MTQSSAIPTHIRTLIQPDVKFTSLILASSPCPVPAANTNEHLVRVHTCAPCSGELLWAKDYPRLAVADKPLVPCPDFAGTVVTSPSSSPFKPGDRVYARTSFARQGCGREYTIATTDELALIPRNLDWVNAAAVPLSALTAWQMLFVHSGLGGIDDPAWEGRRILVTAASGGVGSWIVQLAKLIGAEIVGTCGPDNLDFVKDLGASEVLDYHRVNFRDWANQPGRKVDLALDCIGQKSLEDAWWCVKDGGILLSIFQPPEQMKPTDFGGGKVRDKFFIMKPNGRSLAQVSKLIEEERCKPIVDSVFPLDKFEEAFARLASGHARGKVVIDITRRPKL